MALNPGTGQGAHGRDLPRWGATVETRTRPPYGSPVLDSVSVAVGIPDVTFS